MNLKQTIVGATRIETGEPKLLDHMWVEEQMCYDVLEAGVCTGVSDHAGIYAFIQSAVTILKIVSSHSQYHKTL
jgi:hypothetical protein